MNLIKISFLFLFVFMGVSKVSYHDFLLKTPLEEDLSFAENLVASFIEEMNDFSEKNYDYGIRFYLEDHILIGADANVAWDIPGTGYHEPSLVFRTYMRRLKDLKVQINYESEFELLSCNTQFGNLIGAYVIKNITLQNGDRYRFREFLEVSGTSDINTRIKSITSSKYRSLDDFQCINQETQKSIPETVNEPEIEERCVLFEEAEKAYGRGSFAEALPLYRQSKVCAEDLSYVERKIEELSTIEKQESLLADANKAFSEERFQEAISLFQTYLKTESNDLSISEKEGITQKINAAQTEIAFVEISEKAEYYMSKEYYQQAIVAYEGALELKPGNTSIQSKLREAERLLNASRTANIKQEIARATRLLRTKKQNDALVTLMKYDDSGYLNAEHYWYMANLLDQRPREPRKELGIRGKDYCILTRRYLIKARQLGLAKSDYDYFMQDHFNKRSRTCN